MFPAEKAWDFLIDINKFSTCLPGIDEVKQIDDKTFDGIISANVEPISGKFNFRSTILESRPREQMVVPPRCWKNPVHALARVSRSRSPTSLVNSLLPSPPEMFFK